MLRPYLRDVVFQPSIKNSIQLLRRRHSHPNEPCPRLNGADLVNTSLQLLHLERTLYISEEQASIVVKDSNRLCKDMEVAP